MMKRITFTFLALMFMAPVWAQGVINDGSRVILPLQTQLCDLPSAPPPIPETPVYDDLIKAQKGVKAFQADMQVYRDCVNEDAISAELSDGNRQAIANAHNYSVDMEERVADMFNQAVRAYKASKAEAEEQ